MSAWFHGWMSHPVMLDLAVMLGHSLWQGLVVALVLAGLLRGIKPGRAQARHGIACLALLALVLWQGWTFADLHFKENFDVADLPWADEPRTVTVEAQGRTMARMGKVGPIQGETADFTQAGAKTAWQTWLMTGWLAGMLALTLWRAAGWIGLWRLRLKAERLGGDLAWMARRLAVRMGIKGELPVCWSDKVGSPVVFGWLRPMVVLPLSLATGFTPTQIEMILAHEFAHVKRQDYLVNLLQTLVETVWFFHPAVWWINRQIRREREHACDDAALAVMKDAASYVQALAALAERTLPRPPAMTMAVTGAGRGGELLRRVERLLCRSACRQPWLISPGFVWLTMLSVGMGLWLASGGATAVQADEQAPAMARGTVFDRNGVVLAVSDKPVREVVFDLREVTRLYSQAHGGRPAMETVEETDKEGSRRLRRVDVATMFEEVVLAKLRNLNLARVCSGRILREAYGSPSGLFLYATDVSEEEFARFKAVETQVPAMRARVNGARRYPFGEIAGHVSGYVREERRGEWVTKAVSGVEKAFDDWLKPAVEGKRGSDVRLTLDLRHQSVVERALREMHPELDRGAAVLMEVQTGDVLAMASWPGFDPNGLVSPAGGEVFQKLTQDGRNPMLNRAVRPFTPGAAYLPVTCLAGVAAGQLESHFNCAGMMAINGKIMKCWSQAAGRPIHGSIGMREGLATSCNVYFYQLGNAAGIAKFIEAGRLLGLGQRSGIGLFEEDGGLLPGPEWLAKHRPKEKWSAAYTANMAIGQGYVLANPLQMTVVYAAIANGGTVWRPRLVDRVVTGGKEEKRPALRAANLLEHGLTNEGLRVVQLALEDVVREHTAKRAISDKIRIAGRTGTAQVWKANGEKDNQVWFCGYAPVEKPRWALTVFVQGGHAGGTIAAPMAKHILEQVAAIEAGELEVDLGRGG